MNSSFNLIENRLLDLLLIMAPGTADKKNNVLPLWGNEKTMNLNNLILTNILSSHYFKVNLYQLKTYHEVIDEIYYHVNHLEPWEKGSRKTSGQTGMCGGVRGVGAGGIVSTAFCILYKLFTLKLTRKQVNGLITHCDSPYIRALGFMYIRFTQPPVDLWDWFDPYLDDREELDVKAGGGQIMTIGEILRHFLTKLEWFSTLFPRIPVPIQKDIERKLSERKPSLKTSVLSASGEEELTGAENALHGNEANDHTNEKPHTASHDRNSKHRREGKAKADDGKGSKSTDKGDLADEIARERERQRRDRERVSRSRSPQRHHYHPHHHHERRSRSRDGHKHRERSRERRSSHHDREHEKERERSFKDHHRERDRGSEKKDHQRSRSRSRDRHRSRRHEEHGRSSRDHHHY